MLSLKKVDLWVRDIATLPGLLSFSRTKNSGRKSDISRAEWNFENHIEHRIDRYRSTLKCMMSPQMMPRCKQEKRVFLPQSLDPSIRAALTPVSQIARRS